METQADTPNQDSTKRLAVEMDSEKDHFLQDLVYQTNVFPDNALQITVQVGGLLVSGIMIAGDEYFNLIANLTSQPEASFNKHIASFGASYTSAREEKTINENPVYIHLKDCAYYGGFGLMQLGNIWRGRISAVDGFFMGVLLDKK